MHRAALASGSRWKFRLRTAGSLASDGSRRSGRIHACAGRQRIPVWFRRSFYRSTWARGCARSKIRLRRSTSRTRSGRRRCRRPRYCSRLRHDRSWNCGHRRSDRRTLGRPDRRWRRSRNRFGGHRRSRNRFWRRRNRRWHQSRGRRLRFNRRSHRRRYRNIWNFDDRSRGRDNRSSGSWWWRGRRSHGN
jgi:hypothetical protein